MDETNSITVDSAPLYLRAVGGVACRDCGSWAHEGDMLRHGKRCDFRAVQPRKPAAAQSPRAQARLVADGLVSAAFGGDEDQIVNFVRAGVLSMSDAMNRDD